MIARTPPTNGFFYAPVVDGETLAVPPARAFARGLRARAAAPDRHHARRDAPLLSGKPSSDDGAIAMIAPQLGLPEAEAAARGRRS